MTDVELIKHRLQKLRSLLGTHEFDALIVNRGDEHLSDYLPPNKERLAYITGFTGSAGTAVILKAQSIKDISSSPISIEKEDLTVLLRNTAALFVDGRYTLQARVQANSEFFDSFQYNIVSMIEWLKAILPANSVVGIDPMCVSYNSFNELKN
ncbi:MAG: aminopeptidase P family N-terminal domain-containing protein [Ruminobacter sp.]|nr:aminopeptidase P family N-terminal domain-containing protein [Ruminobacter sp.]